MCKNLTYVNIHSLEYQIIHHIVKWSLLKMDAWKSQILMEFMALPVALMRDLRRDNMRLGN